MCVWGGGGGTVPFPKLPWKDDLGHSEAQQWGEESSSLWFLVWIVRFSLRSLMHPKGRHEDHLGLTASSQYQVYFTRKENKAQAVVVIIVTPLSKVGRGNRRAWPFILSPALSPLQSRWLNSHCPGDGHPKNSCPFLPSESTKTYAFHSAKRKSYC